MPRTRQLAAIMFTDIQGYTAIMQHDEELGIKMRDRHREIFKRITEKFSGTILQYFGDGTLSTFKSAIDAVKCAMEMQMAFQKEPVIPVRIGIHLGDIVITEDDIIGDGVNVASRIESLAVPGSVFISDKVYDEIKNHSSIEAQSLKTFELKNVDKPIEVFAISNKGLVIPNVDEIVGKTKDKKSVYEKTPEKLERKISKKKLNWIPYSIIGLLVIVAGYFIYKNVFPSDPKIDDLDKSIAILAFKNMSGDPNQEYFSDGISEEILNSLVKVEGLQVAGRTSSFSFKGKDTDIQTIGKELGVSLVLEGSVRKSESRVRITVQLINAINGFHIWSGQFDREMTDIFLIQEEIATEIVSMLELSVLKLKKTGTPTDNMEAYDYYLKGKSLTNRDFEGANIAIDYFQRAIELDPEFALAYAGMGEAYITHSEYGIISNKVAYSEARRFALKSIALDDQQTYGHIVLATVYMFYDWNWEAAKTEYLKAVELGHPDPDVFITTYNTILYEDYDKAIQDAKKIALRNPLDAFANLHLGWCYLVGRQYENAIASFDQTLELDSIYSEAYRLMGRTFGLMGNYDASLKALNKSLEIMEGMGPAQYDIIINLAHSGKTAEAEIKLKQILESQDEQYIDPGLLAGVYASLGRLDEAFNLLERCYDERNDILVYIKALPRFDMIRTDPRYTNIVKRMNFPK